MTSTSTVRRDNLRQIASEYESVAALADRIGMTRQQMSALFNEATPFGEKMARKIEAALGLTPGRLDRRHEAASVEGLTAGELLLAQRISRLSSRDQKAVRALVDSLLDG